MKKLKIVSVTLVEGIKLKGKSASGNMAVLSRDRVDTMELLNQSWLRVVKDGFTTLIPTTNVAQMLVEDDEE